MEALIWVGCILAACLAYNYFLAARQSMYPRADDRAGEEAQRFWRSPLAGDRQ